MNARHALTGSGSGVNHENNLNQENKVNEDTAVKFPGNVLRKGGIVSNFKVKLDDLVVQMAVLEAGVGLASGRVDFVLGMLSLQKDFDDVFKSMLRPVLPSHEAGAFHHRITGAAAEGVFSGAFFQASAGAAAPAVRAMLEDSPAESASPIAAPAQMRMQ